MRYSSRPVDSSDSQHTQDAWWGVHGFPLLNSRIIQRGKCVWVWQSLTSYFFHKTLWLGSSEQSPVCGREGLFGWKWKSSELLLHREPKPRWVHLAVSYSLYVLILQPRYVTTALDQLARSPQGWDKNEGSTDVPSPSHIFCWGWTVDHIETGQYSLQLSKFGHSLSLHPHLLFFPSSKWSISGKQLTCKVHIRYRGFLLGLFIPLPPSSLPKASAKGNNSCHMWIPLPRLSLGITSLLTTSFSWETISPASVILRLAPGFLKKRAAVGTAISRQMEVTKLTC